MALRWLVHSACHVLGHPNNNIEDGHGDMMIKKLKIGEDCMDMYPSGFQMPLHYPRYTKADYEKMAEWKVDLLLRQYGLNFKGALDEKRAFAMGAFLWPDQY
ncbi:hypothetical protein SLE2022_367920 [Rubroshorea leprosula]